jgi:hypothetical protein
MVSPAEIRKGNVWGSTGPTPLQKAMALARLLGHHRGSSCFSVQLAEWGLAVPWSSSCFPYGFSFPVASGRSVTSTVPVDVSSRRYAGELLFHSVFIEPRAAVKDNSSDICFSVWRSMRNWDWLSAEKLVVLLELCNLNGQEDSLGHVCSLAPLVTTAGNGVKLSRVKPVAVTLCSQGSRARQNSRPMWASCPQGIVFPQCPEITIVS